jgi:hypothetical protein
MESGSATITDRNIMVICKIYSINEEWLREDKGDMFKTYNSLDKYKEDFFEIFEQLTPETQQSLLSMAEVMLAKQEQL